MSIQEHIRRMDEKIASDIKRTGLSIIGVGGSASSPGFCYTIGLTKKYGFELLVLGLPMQHALAMFNQIASSDTPPALDVPVTEIANLPLMFKRCTVDISDLHDSFVCQADRFLGEQVNVVQMVLSDRAGLFPGDPQYDHAYMDRFQRLFYRPFLH